MWYTRAQGTPRIRVYPGPGCARSGLRSQTPLQLGRLPPPRHRLHCTGGFGGQQPSGEPSRTERGSGGGPSLPLMPAVGCSRGDKKCNPSPLKFALLTPAPLRLHKCRNPTPMARGATQFFHRQGRRVHPQTGGEGCDELATLRVQITSGRFGFVGWWGMW